MNEEEQKAVEDVIQSLKQKRLDLERMLIEIDNALKVMTRMYDLVVSLDA